jgi:hypothetical protein
MSTVIESNTFTSRRDEASTECTPLLDVATKDLFRKNAFRITGLPVDTTARDIAKHAEKLKVLAELGQNPQLNASFPLRPSPTVEDIREAIQKLKDPEKRLIDEFFWFWPENFGQSRSDGAIEALERGDLKGATEIWMSKRKHSIEGVVATHNLALIFHILALDWEDYALKTEIDAKRRAEITKYWETAFYRWGRILTNEQLWEKVVTRIRQLNEPNLTTGFARRMRATLPVALSKINAELAIAFAESGKLESALLHIQLIRAPSEGLANAEKAAELVLTPARKRITGQVRQAKERADNDPRDAITAARQLLEQVREPLALFDLFFDKDSQFRNDVFDEVAEICNQLQVTYHKATNDNESCLEFLKTVLPFAGSQELRERIETNIQTLTENIEAIRRDKKFYANLKPISSVPSLSTINGIGFRLYGSADVDPANGSYLATYYFTFLWLPIFPIRRYRVTGNGNAYTFFGKAPLSLGDKWHLAISIGLILWLVIAVMLAGNSSQSANIHQYSSPSTESVSGAYAPPSVNSTSSGADTASSTLVSEKAAIESERAVLDTFEAHINSLLREIERERLYLDQRNGDAIQQFNAKVYQYNSLLQQDKNATAAFNQKVSDYNAKLRGYNR